MPPPVAEAAVRSNGDQRGSSDVACNRAKARYIPTALVTAVAEHLKASLWVVSARPLGP